MVAAVSMARVMGQATALVLDAALVVSSSTVSVHVMNSECCVYWVDTTQVGLR